MYTGMLGASAFMDWRGGLKTATGIACFAAGAIIGWPFALLLGAPFGLEEVLLTLVSIGDTDRLVDAIRRVSKGVLLALLILVSTVSCYPTQTY